MEVIVYTRPDCESSRQIKEILENRGVAFQEHVCADGKLDGKDLRNLDIEWPAAGQDRASDRLDRLLTDSRPRR
ncbi:MAG: glutaredoxin [Chloroflexi bacterium]|nr:MAG: glutaredoxin [Chloroflexota bacterium]